MFRLMKRWGRVLPTAVVAAMVCSCAATAAVAEDRLSSREAAVKEVVARYFQALNHGDVNTIVKAYHEDAVFLPPGKPAVRGIKAIENAYRSIFQRIDIETTHTYFDISVHADIGIVESASQGKVTKKKSDKTIDTANNELFVLKNINGQWTIDRYMFNGRGQE